MVRREAPGWKDTASGTMLGVKKVLNFPQMLLDPFKKCIILAPACATSVSAYSDPDRGPTLEITSVDIVFKRSSFEDKIETPTSITLNSCDGDANTSANYAFRTALHESGHALGLTGYSRVKIALLQDYVMSHPTIYDSVMNYKIERDCSPHPFDIMAIYGLYQVDYP